MLLLNLQKCRVKPAEQNHVKLYDPIGMTPLCQVSYIPLSQLSYLKTFNYCLAFHTKRTFFTH